MAITANFDYASKMPKKLTPEQKKLYKMSLAKMMVFWIINTRHSWRQKLLDKDFDYWKANLPCLASAFTGEEVEWEKFFNMAYAIVHLEPVADMLESINGIADAVWVQTDFDPVCPADEAIDLMFRAFAEHVDNLPST